jgi:four helix bundle protein
MTAKRFEDLICWQRMNELSIEVWKATDRPPASKDFDFRDEIRDASDSAQRNVAEGFGRYSPPQFVNFLDFSRASALETKALLKKGLSVGYWTQDEFRRLDTLANRGLQTVARLQRYLRSPPRLSATLDAAIESSGALRTIRTIRTLRTLRTVRTIRTFVGNQPCPPLERQERNRPLEQHHDAIAEADQHEDMQEEPG